MEYHIDFEHYIGYDYTKCNENFSLKEKLIPSPSDDNNVINALLHSEQLENKIIEEKIDNDNNKNYSISINEKASIFLWSGKDRNNFIFIFLFGLIGLLTVT